MEKIVRTLSTLGHPARLDIFRLLMRRYPDRLPAGEIATALGLKPNTLSVNIGQLHEVGLVTRTRLGTSLLYQLDLDGARALLSGLFHECCRGRADLCLPLSLDDLPDLGRNPGRGPRGPINVLFVCTGNSARSLFAEALLRERGEGRFAAFSAGTRPAASPNPEAIELLRAKGHDVRALRSKSLESLRDPDAPVFDFVFTVCDRAANEDCPAWPGQPVSGHWGVADPTRATGTEAERRLAFQHAYGTLRNRIAAFAALPLESLDRLSLQRAVDEIARTPVDA